MKNGILLAGIILIVVACNKNNDLEPVNNFTPYQNLYAGTYFGVFSDTSNGVDSNGIFKLDTTYSIMLVLTDGGIEKKGVSHPSVFDPIYSSNSRYTFSINKGPFSINSVPIDSDGKFEFVTKKRNFSGQFVNDSLFINYKGLNGSYNYPQWFVIQKLAFKGVKLF